jgi:hypothetical protein
MVGNKWWCSQGLLEFLTSLFFFQALGNPHVYWWVGLVQVPFLVALLIITVTLGKQFFIPKPLPLTVKCWGQKTTIKPLLRWFNEDTLVNPFSA